MFGLNLNIMFCFYVILEKLSYEYIEVFYGVLGVDDFILKIIYLVFFKSVFKIFRMFCSVLFGIVINRIYLDNV